MKYQNISKAYRLTQENFRRFAVTVPLALGLLILYYPTFVWLVKIWVGDKEYSHGFLVPFVSIYLAWRKRSYFSAKIAKPCRVTGGGLLLVSAFLLIAGRSGGIALAEGVSFLLVLPALILFVWGWERLKVLALPLFYLQFMVPWVEEFIDRIHMPFQQFSALMAVWILKIIGLSIFLDGTYIYLPNITLEVARDCSGVRFLTSVIALGLPLVYVTQKSWLRAAFVIASGFIITILANGLRVAFVSIIADKYGSGLAHGPFHVFQGWFVAQIGFIALVLVNWMVCKISTSRSFVLCDAWKGYSVDSTVRCIPPGKRKEVIIAVVFLGLQSVYLYEFAIPKPVPPGIVLSLFPHTIGDWRGSEDRWINGAEYFPGVDDQVAMHYSLRGNRDIYVYVGYFSVQRQGKSLINYHANPLRNEVTPVSIFSSDPLGPGKVEMTTLNIDGVKYNAALWYRVVSSNITGRYETKLTTIIEAILHHRNNGAVFILAVPMKEGKDIFLSAEYNRLVNEIGEIGSTVVN